MIRVALFLVVVGLIALGVSWLADRPGEVAVTWLGWRIAGWEVGFPWVFNVADASITVGAVFLVLEILLEGRLKKGVRIR